MYKALFVPILFALLLAAHAAQAAQSGDSRYEWLNGKWESRTKVFFAEFKVVNRNEVIGEATLRYSKPSPGQRSGSLQGKIIDDNTIQINVDWPSRSTEYEFRKQDDGSLLGTITKGTDAGTTIRLRKQD